MTKQKRMIRRSRRLTAALLCLGLTASLCVGLGIDSKSSQAAAIEMVESDTSQKVQWAYTVSDGKATNVHIKTFIGANNESLGPTITVPASFTDNGVTYNVVSIGSDNASSDEDSFMDSIVVSHIPTTGTFTIDASTNATGLTTVNRNVLKGRSNTTLMLPKALTTVSSGVLAPKSGDSDSGKNNAIVCDALNATYANKTDIDQTTFSFKGFMNSTAHDDFGTMLGDDPTKGGRFTASADTTGSIKYTINSSESKNDDIHTPASFAGGATGPFSGYIYKSMASGYKEYNIPTASDVKGLIRDHHTFLGYFTATTSGQKLFNNNATLYESVNFSDTAFSGANVTLYAQWTPGTLNITYNPSTGTGAISGTMPTDHTTAYGSTTTLKDNVYTQVGHTFAGWTDIQGSTSKKYNDKATTPELYDDLDLYACWTQNSYTVNYNANGGTGTTSPQTVLYDNLTRTYLEQGGFARDGYDFKGWSLVQNPTSTDIIYTNINSVDIVLRADATANSLTTEYDIYSDTHDSITLYAVWEKGSYTINYVDTTNGAQFASNPEVRECGNTASPLPNRPAITGHTFLGWEGQVQNNGITSTVSIPAGSPPPFDLAPNGGSVTLNAVYRTHTFTIKYLRSKDSDGTLDDGNDMNDTSCTYGSTVTTLRNCSFTRTGCKFVGWKQLSIASSSASAPAAPTSTSLNSSESANIGNSITFTAGQNTSSIYNVPDGGVLYVYHVWQKEIYTIHYQGDGATSLSDDTYEYGDTIHLTTLTMNDHTFKGWMESDTLYSPGASINTKDKGMARNLTFTAAWDNDHFITISPDSYIKTITANVNGTKKNLVSNGTLASLTFKGGESFTGITITSIDNYRIKAYKITDDSGDVKASATYNTPSETITVGPTVTFPTGSNLNIAITPEAKTYRITFNTDGGTIVDTTPTTYSYGVGLDLPKFVVKDNATFYGWKNSSGTIVNSISKTQTGDLTFTAVWTNPNVMDLPQGAKATASTNGKYLIITYKNNTTEDIHLPSQNITLKNGSNSVQFKSTDGKTYLTTVNYTTPTELPSSVKLTYATGAATATVTYTDGTTQTVAVNKYNSDVTAAGTKIYFDGIDGKRYVGSPSSATEPSPSPSASPDPTDDSGNRKPQPDEYYMISKISYNVRNGKATATNPFDWDATSITVKSSVKIYGKNYKVTKISPEAFYGMLKLKTLVIGKNVRSIGRNAARDCTRLKTIKILTGDITSMGKNWLKNISKKATVYIKASKSKYKKLRNTIRKKSGCPKSTRFQRIKS